MDFEIELIPPTVELMDDLDGEDILRKIELCGRTCYKSEERITDESSRRFVKTLIDRGHLSVLEHVSVTMRIIGDRSMSHQLVRHRIAAYSQESQRFCDYGRAGRLQVIVPPSIVESDLFPAWKAQVESAYRAYLTLRESGKVKPEDARSVLPNCVKTEVVTTFNLRQWRHVIRERALNSHAQWQIRALITQALFVLSENIPVVFDDLLEEYKKSTNWQKLDRPGGSQNLTG